VVVLGLAAGVFFLMLKILLFKIDNKKINFVLKLKLSAKFF